MKDLDNYFKNKDYADLIKRLKQTTVLKAGDNNVEYGPPHIQIEAAESIEYLMRVLNEKNKNCKCSVSCFD